MNEFEKDIIVKAGDKKSIEEFCNATWQPLYRYIYIIKFKIRRKQKI